VGADTVGSHYTTDRKGKGKKAKDKNCS